MAETNSDALRRHANILRSIRLMALSRRGLIPDENRMLQDIIDDLDLIADQLDQSGADRTREG